jgi:hypothetical protein
MTEAAPTAPVVATPPGAPPPAPSTPQEAASKLAELRANKDWGDRVLKSDPGALKEMRDLSRLVAQGSDVDRIMAGEPDLPNLSVGGQLSLKSVADAVPALRAAGISDGAIHELLSDRKPTAEEFMAVKRFKSMRHGDESWVKRFLAGDFEARRESTLMNMILLHEGTT